jgi:tetratricopeptide (TPR) repeat protein
LSLQPDFVDAQLALASLEVKAGRYADAIKIAQQMVKQSAKSPIGYIVEGDIMMAEKKFKQAAKLYETAYGLEKSSTVIIKLHAAYLQAGNVDEAEGRLAHWLKESPDDEVVRLYAAESGLKSGNYQNAIAQYEWLLKKAP